MIVTVGRKTGEERMNPVRWFPAGGDARLIVASASGADVPVPRRVPRRAHPDRVRIEYAGQRIDVVPEQLHGAERAAAWAQITAAAHGFAKYERVTDREIPVIRLTPRPTG